MRKVLGSTIVVGGVLLGAWWGLHGRRPALPTESRDTKNGPESTSGRRATSDEQRDSPGQAGQRRPRVASTRAKAPPKFVRAFPRVPAPAAYNATGDDNVDFVAFFNGEERNPVWAPAMEQALEKILTPERMRELGIEGTRMSSRECRSSACALEFEYPIEVADSLPLERSGNRVKPVGVINTKTDAL